MPAGRPRYDDEGVLKKQQYKRELHRPQEELVGLQYRIKEHDLRVCVVFKGHDAAGKGGVTERTTRWLNPRVARVVTLGKPTGREQGQWYLRRYVEQLPTEGEIVLFDRSWYNHTGVRQVTGFCTNGEYEEFPRICPEFERMLVRPGVILVKYWFSISDKKQGWQSQERTDDPKRRWKLSLMDLEACSRWVECSKARDRVFEHTDIDEAPWHAVRTDVKRHARLDCISHLLDQINHKDLTPDPVELPPRQDGTGYERPPVDSQNWVPARFRENPVDD